MPVPEPLSSFLRSLTKQQKDDLFRYFIEDTPTFVSEVVTELQGDQSPKLNVLHGIQLQIEDLLDLDNPDPNGMYSGLETDSPNKTS